MIETYADDGISVIEEPLLSLSQEHSLYILHHEYLLTALLKLIILVSSVSELPYLIPQARIYRF